MALVVNNDVVVLDPSELSSNVFMRDRSAANMVKTAADVIGDLLRKRMFFLHPSGQQTP